jgi:hypothetical protein
MTAEQPQWMDAMEQANHIRLRMAEGKRLITAGEISAVEVFRCPEDPRFAPMRVTAILESQRRWAATRTGKFLTEVTRNRSLYRDKSIGQTRLRDLTPREREILAEEVERVNPNHDNEGDGHLG